MRIRTPGFTLTALAALASPVASAAQISAAPSLMNFQGRLANSNGTPVANGTYSIRFSLWNAVSGGAEQWNQTIGSVSVKNGTFAVLLSGFSATTFNANVWLEVKIGAAAALTPRQQVVSVAYAMKANSVADGSITNSSIAAGTITADRLASGVLNSNAWLLSGNSGASTGFLGTTDAQPLVIKTNGAEALRIDATGRLTMGSLVYTSGKANIGGGLYVEGTNGPAIQGTDMSSSSVGLYGTGYWGVYGNSSADNGYGVEGDVYTIGATGVYGHSSSTSGGNGVMGQAVVGYGMVGYGSYGGIYGASTGTSGTPAGVEGHGVYGLYGFGSTAGVYAGSGGPNAVYATSSGSVGNGVYGISTGSNGTGIKGQCDTGAAAYGVWGLSTSGYAGYFSGKVNVTGTFTNSSDRRLKTNIEPLIDPLQSIMSMRGVSFDWNRSDYPSMNFPVGKQIGFIAQEVEAVFPELVVTDPTSGYKSVAYTNVVPITVEAIKSLKRENDDLKSRLSSVEARNAALEARLDALAKAVEAQTKRK